LGSFGGISIGILGEFGLPPYRNTWGVGIGILGEFGRPGIGILGELVSEDLGSSIGRLGAFWGAACVQKGIPAPRPRAPDDVDQSKIFRF
jgi:hypothetical protein